MAPATDQNGDPLLDQDGKQIYLSSSQVYLGEYCLTTPDNNQDRLDPAKTPGVEASSRLYVVDDTQIKLVVPNLENAGDYELRVVNPDTATATSRIPFKFQVPASTPKIIDLDGNNQAIEPDKGSVNGGSVVTIEGYDFRGGTEVFFGGKAATVSALKDLGVETSNGLRKTMLTVMTPAIPKAADGRSQTVEVMVINPDGGSAVAWQGFTYVNPDSSPQIISVTPNTGPASGGQEVVIVGRDFRVGPAPANERPVVTIGGIIATVTDFEDDILRNEQSIRLITPSSPTAGAKDVVVTNSDMGTVTKKGGYTYQQSQPRVTSVIPARVSQQGDTVVLVNGANFMPSIKDNNGVVIRPGTRVYMQTDRKQTDGSLIEVELTDADALDALDIDPEVTRGGKKFSRVEVIDDTNIRLFTLAQDSIGQRTLRFVNPDLERQPPRWR